jgi:hypothetical protein
LQNRTYFFNVKENRMGDLYLNIVESKNRETGGFDRQSVILCADDLQEFLKGFDESLRVLEKEMRERRRSAKAAVREAKGETGGERHSKSVKHGKSTGEKTSQPDKPHRERPGKERKRVIVKKR